MGRKAESSTPSDGHEHFQMGPRHHPARLTDARCAAVSSTHLVHLAEGSWHKRIMSPFGDLADHDEHRGFGGIVVVKGCGRTPVHTHRRAGWFDAFFHFAGHAWRRSATAGADAAGAAGA